MISSCWIAVVVVGLLNIINVDATFVVNCNAITVQRVDPIVSPGSASSHVHIIQGPNTFSSSCTNQDLLSATCTTCGFAEDLSAYWTPNIYYKRLDGTYEFVNDGGIAAYYLTQRGSNPNEIVSAFPAGFRMIAGSSTRRTFNPNSVADQSVQYVCTGTPAPIVNGMVNQTIDCPTGLRAQILFPNCWDGVNVDSPDHQSHVAYSSEINYGDCPSTHPHRLVTLFVENYFDISLYVNGWINPQTGIPFRPFPFVLSMNDATGYGFHADFMNGWNVTTLQKAIDTCDTSAPCDVFTVVSGDERSNCQLDANRVNPFPTNTEQVYGQVWALPNFPSTQNIPRPFSSSVHLGCFADSIGNRVLPISLGADSNLNNPQWCINLAKQRGLLYAGVEFGRECYGGNVMPTSQRSMFCTYPCPAPMPDNDVHFCGGAGAINVYAVNGTAYNQSGFTMSSVTVTN